MNQIKCKDYYIVKVRYYASPYYLKQFHEGKSKGIKKHHEAASKHSEFYWAFMERASGKNSDHFFKEFCLGARECATEEINETHGIIILFGEGWVTYLIPKDKNSDLFDWVKSEVKSREIPNKIVGKVQLGWGDYSPTTWQRENYKTPEKYAELFKEKI